MASVQQALRERERGVVSNSISNFDMLHYFDQCSTLFPILQYLHLPKKGQCQQRQECMISSGRGESTVGWGWGGAGAPLPLCCPLDPM
jgi:hypothetical protein